MARDVDGTPARQVFASQLTNHVNRSDLQKMKAVSLLAVMPPCFALDQVILEESD